MSAWSIFLFIVSLALFCLWILVRERYSFLIWLLVTIFAFLSWRFFIGMAIGLCWATGFLYIGDDDNWERIKNKIKTTYIETKCRLALWLISW